MNSKAEMEGDKAAMLHVEIEQNQGLIYDALLHALRE